MSYPAGEGVNICQNLVQRLDGMEQQEALAWAGAENSMSDSSLGSFVGLILDIIESFIQRKQLLDHIDKDKSQNGQRYSELR